MTCDVELVVFDLGEVLSVHPPHLDALAEIVHADREAFAPAYWRHRHGYDLGGRPDRYWTAVAGDAGQSVTPDQVAELTDLDASAWSALHSASLPLLGDLRAAAVPVALLSNAPRPLATAVRAQPWAEWLTALVFSCDVGVVKPDPLSYAAVTDRTGTAPDRVVFFDDRADNVVGARKAGWLAHLWSGHAQARVVLSALGVAVARK